MKLMNKYETIGVLLGIIFIIIGYINKNTTILNFVIGISFIFLLHKGIYNRLHNEIFEND